MAQALCREQTCIRVRPARIYIDSRAWRDLLVAGCGYHIAPVGRVDVDDLAQRLVLISGCVAMTHL